MSRNGYEGLTWRIQPKGFDWEERPRGLDFMEWLGRIGWEVSTWSNLGQKAWFRRIGPEGLAPPEA